MVKLRPERKEDKSGWPWAFEELWSVLRARWAGFTAEQRPALPHWGTHHPVAVLGQLQGRREAWRGAAVAG